MLLYTVVNFSFQNKDAFPTDLGVTDLDEVNDYEDEEEEENDLDSEEEEASVWEDGCNDVSSRPLDRWTKRPVTLGRDAQELVQSLRQEGETVQGIPGSRRVNCSTPRQCPPVTPVDTGPEYVILNFVSSSKTSLGFRRFSDALDGAFSVVTPAMWVQLTNLSQQTFHEE